MACCIGRGGAETLLPNGQDSAFDRQVLSAFTKLLDQGGVIRTSPSLIRRKQIDGTLGLVAQFSSEHYLKKRKPDEAPRDEEQAVVVDSVDPAAFNFAKANDSEVICEIEAFDGEPSLGSMRTTVLTNISPLATGHILLVPQRESLRPQVLTQDLLLGGLHLLMKSGRKDFRLMFNSRQAFSSVNHFHFHGFYLNYCGLTKPRLPIEMTKRSVVAGNLKEGHVQVEILNRTWYVPGFLVSAGPCTGAQGDQPKADLTALANTAYRVVKELQSRNIAHSVVLAPPLVERKERRSANDGLATDAEQGAGQVMTPEVLIVPRKFESDLRATAGFNAAVMEVSGVIIAHSEEAYEGLSEAEIQEIFQQDVALPDPLLEEIICKVAWMPA